MLDYLNVRHAEAVLTPEEVREIDGVIYRLTRWTDARHFFKRIMVEDGTAAPLEYMERVARFGLQDFERMFALTTEYRGGARRLSPEPLRLLRRRRG